MGNSRPSPMVVPAAPYLRIDPANASATRVLAGIFEDTLAGFWTIEVPSGGRASEETYKLRPYGPDRLPRFLISPKKSAPKSPANF